MDGNNEGNEDVIQRFEDWMKEQTVFNNKKEIAQQLQIGSSHFGNVLSRRRPASHDLLERMAMMIRQYRQGYIASSSSLGKERPYLEFTEELRKWFSKQDRWQTQKELAEYLGMPYSSLKKFFQGRSFPREDVRKKLYELTSIEMLGGYDVKDAMSGEDVVKVPQTPSFEEHIDEIAKATTIIRQELEVLDRKLTQSRKSSHSREQGTSLLDRIAVAFYELAKELLSFRKSGIAERQELRKRIPPKDVGYVISFLKALYDEEKFSDFIFFTEYKFERKVGQQ